MVLVMSLATACNNSTTSTGAEPKAGEPSASAGAGAATGNAAAGATAGTAAGKVAAGESASTADHGFPVPQEDIALTAQPEQRRAVFAGGCFWCTEAVFEQVAGVSEVISGYSGGSPETATYEQVCTGRTGHAEAIAIVYDASKVSYGQLLRIFFATHNPTTLNAQGPDRGSQYRSAVFYASEDEQRIAKAYIQQLEHAHIYPRPIVTTLEPLAGFYPAEDYHQDYARRNPFQPYIEAWAQPKVQKLYKRFPDMVKSAAGQSAESDQ